VTVPAGIPVVANTGVGKDICKGTFDAARGYDKYQFYS
jgi:hypothetical protein